MARRKHNKSVTSPSDLEILFSDREVTLAGKTFTMRELRFAEQLKYHHLLEPIIKRFDEHDLEKTAVEDSVNNVIDILSAEYESVVPLMSISSGQSVNWIKNLPAAVGEEMVIFWWATNSHFFIRRQVRKAQSKILLTVQTGEMSSHSSSAQDTLGNNSHKVTPSDK